MEKLSLMHAPFLLGLIAGGAVIYWFTGASAQAVTTGAYRAVEFIKKNIKLESSEKASVADSKKVVEICTQYAQKGMFNIFLTVFFATLSFAFLEPFFFIGYLISIALFGLYPGNLHGQRRRRLGQRQESRGNRTPRQGHRTARSLCGRRYRRRSLQGHQQRGLNPIIKFTTLFGLLAVSLAVDLTNKQGAALTDMLAAVFFLVSAFFVYRSFYGMRIEVEK